MLVAAASVLAFFYIARLRVVMVPSLAIFAGAAVARIAELSRGISRLLDDDDPVSGTDCESGRDPVAQTCETGASAGRRKGIRTCVAS